MSSALGARVCACVAVVIGMVIVFKRTPMTGITFGDDGVTLPSGLFANWADVTAIRTIDDYVAFDTVDANRYVADPRFQPVTRRLMERFGTPLAFNVVGFHASLTEIVDTARRLWSASAKRRD